MVKVKVTVYVYSPDIPSRFGGLYINYPHVLERTLSVSSLNPILYLSIYLFISDSHYLFIYLNIYAAQISAAEAIHTVPSFVPPGTHYSEVSCYQNPFKLKLCQFLNISCDAFSVFCPKRQLEINKKKTNLIHIYVYNH